VGERARTPDRTTDKPTDRQASGQLGSRAALSNCRALAVRRCSGLTYSVTIRLPRVPAYMYLHSPHGATVALQHRTPPVSKFKGCHFEIKA